jgi:hypothetical protein
VKTHVVIPDTQAKAGVPTAHLAWIGEYIADQFVDEDIELIHLGDHADMPSLSSWDKGKKQMEGRRYIQDIESANDAFNVLNRPIARAERAAVAKAKASHRAASTAWKPKKRILLGNHEDRISRAAEDNAQLEGLVSLDDLNYADHGWQVHPFLELVELDGVTYSHYFYHPMTGRAYSGENLLLRLKNIGYSFTMGHQQTLGYSVRFVGRHSQHALVAGSCYLHDEEYKGPQGNSHWRGIVVCHEVRHGSYDPMFVSLDFLCRKYEGVSLETFAAASHIGGR